MSWLIPIWIGIFFNTVMAIYPSLASNDSSFARWYLAKAENFWLLMGSVWGVIICWSLLLGLLS